MYELQSKDEKIMPKVSVLMPVYKTKEAYLREAIESILNQSFTDFEFLILDDCPEDNREEIVKSYHDARIKYSKNEHNLGITPSRNKLIGMAKGEYLAVFDHDDISLPERLEKEVAYLDAHPEVGVVSSSIEKFPKIKVSNPPQRNLDIKMGLMRGCIVAHTTAMIRKSVLESFGIRYEEEYSPAEDYMLFLRLVGKTMFYNIPEVLVRYRNFEGNTSHIQKEKMDDASARCQCFAAREYPHLYSKVNFLGGNRRIWLDLFNIIPFIQLNVTPKGFKIRLFGLISLFSIRGK